MLRRLLALSAVLLTFLDAFSQTSLISYGSTWKYLDNGTDQATSWRALNFNDGSWKSGNGKFGYGIPDATTTVSYGTNTNKKYITTYFRKAITISNPAGYSVYTVKLKRDDGIVVYVNGVEVNRNNMPAGTILYSTLASTASDNGTIVQTFTIPVTSFISGTNIISAEVHQSAAASTDIAFDLELTATVNPSPPPPASDVLVNFNSSWKYLDNGTNQGTAWKATSFNDAAWGTGTGKFGYGINDNAWNISYGTSATQKYITTYFRKSISVANPALFPALAGMIKRDDGVIVYINGQEVYRNNLPTGTVGYTTLGTEATDNGSTAQPFTINSPGLVAGTNVIAVEVHQAKANTPDMAFDMELRAAAPIVASIKRQQPTTSATNATSVTHRVKFSSPVSGVDATDFTITVISGTVSSSIAANAVVAVGTGGDTYDVTTSAISGNGEIRLDLKNSGTGITSATGIQIAGGFTSGETYIINQSVPVVTGISRQLPLTAITNATSVIYRVIFSQQVTGVDKSDFAISVISGTVTGVLAANAVAPVGTGGTTYDVTISGITGNGSLRLDLNSSGTGIINSVNTPIASGFTTGQVYTINQMVPSTVSIKRQVPLTDITNASTVTLRVIFSEAVTGVDRTDFTMNVISGNLSGALPVNAVASVGIDGTTYDVTINTLSGNGVLRLDLNSSGTGIINSIGTPIAAGFTSGETYTINQAVPAVLSINRQTPTSTSTNASSVTHRVIFSQPVTGVDKNDFTLTIVSGTVTGTIGSNAVAPVGTDGTTYDVTTSAITGNGTIRLDLNSSGTGIINSIGTAIAAGFTSGETYTINQSAPAVVSISRQLPATATTNAASVTHRVTFSQAVTGVDNNDFTLTIISGTLTGTIGSSAVAIVGTDGTTYDVTTSNLSGNGTLRLDLNTSGTGITNTFGTAITAGFSAGETYTINQTAPVAVSINRQSPATATTNASAVTHRVTFSEAVTGVDNTDFTLTIVSGTVSGTIGSSAVTSVGTDGTTYDVTTSAITGNGTIRVDLNNSGTGITNLIGTAINGGFASGQAYTINQTAPAVVSINRQSPSSATTNSTSVTHRVIFSETVTGVDNNDFTLAIVSGTVSGTIGSSAVVPVGADGTTYDVTTSAISGNGTFRIDLNSSGTGITNLIGTAINGGFASGQAYTINQTAPSVISINRQSPASATTNASSVTHRVIFSEAVSGVDNSDFTLSIVSGTVSGTIGSSAVAAVGTDGTTYDVTTSAITGNGTIRVDLNNSGTGITNLIGTAINGGFASGQAYTINQTAPAVISINRQAPASATTNGTSVTHRVIFSEAVTGVDNNDFTLTIVSGTVSGTIGSSAVAAVGAEGTTYDVTTNAINGNGTIRLDLNNSGTGITNTIGTSIAGGFSSGETYTINQTAPVVLSINRQLPASATTNATTVTHRVIFSEAVTGVDNNDFSLNIISGTVTGTIGGSAVAAVGTDGTTYDVTTSSIAGNGILRLDLKASGTGITNTTGTAISGGFISGETYTINQAIPSVVSINRQSPASATTNANTVTHRITFSEAVTGVDNNDFTLTIISGTVNGSIGSAAVAAIGTDGTTYDVTTSGITGNGVFRLDLNASGTGITNSIGTAITSGFATGETYTINQSIPSVVSINRQTPASATTNAANVTHRVTFSEAVTGVDKNDFNITIVSGTVTGTIGTSAVTAVGTDGTTYDVTTSSISGNGVLRLDLNASGTGITNSVGTGITSGFSTGETYTINQTAPAVTSIKRQLPLTSSTSATSVTWRTIFSELVTGVDKNDFTFTVVSGSVAGTLAANAVQPVGSDGTTYDITATNVSGSGVIRLSLNNTGTGITNSLGTPIATGYSTGETYTVAPVGTQVLFPYKSAWKYLDNGSDQGTAWSASTFNDNSWSTGNGLFGYGQGGEGTVIYYGTNSALKYVTTYFRKTINVLDTSEFTGYTLNFRRDDGAVIYLNGQEIYRTNLPTGPITYTTLAPTNVSDNGTAILSVPLTLSQIKQGNNVLAVEIHQFTRGSSDIVFDMEMKGNTNLNPPKLENGPYMNLATQNSIIIRWRTDSLTDTRVNYGTSVADLSGSFVDNTLTREHIAEIKGLQENTKYFYAVRAGARLLQGDANNYFKTLPPVGSTQKVRVLVTGDVGTNSSAQVNVRNAYQAYNGTNYTDVWMLLGDNAYNNGLDTEYGNNFFNVYEGSLTKNHVLWPAPGNHDYANTGARQADHQIPYYNLFSLPTKAEAGGVASNNEAYYSYDYGNIHFVSLDSYGWEAGNTRLYDTTGAQATWLKQDLAANRQKWTVVYFHHPPYTKGSHNSDTEQELISMRQKLVPILERYKVDLVLNGHSHSYERSFMINGHYGLEPTFDTATMAFSNSSGKYDGSSNSCLYVKKASDPKNKIVYAVVGSSGQVNGSTAGYPHNAMQYSNITNSGALVIEIEDNRLDAKWICNDGVMRDQFTIIKEAGKTTDTTIASGNQLVLTASWQGTYQWSTGATTRSISVTPATNTSYTVSDGVGCLNDVYNVTVTGAAGLAKMGTDAKELNALAVNSLNVKVAPNPSAGQFFVTLETTSTENVVLSVSDMFGRQVHIEKGAPKKVYSLGRTLSPGMYILRLEQGNKSKTLKIIKQ